MRQIGTISSNEDASRFGAFLLTLGIDNKVEESANVWAVWVENDDHLDRARMELEKFQTAPGEAHYDQALHAAGSLQAEKQKLEQRRRENFVDVRTQPSRARQWNVPITMLLFGISLMVGLLTQEWTMPRPLAEESPLVNRLRIEPLIPPGYYLLGLPAVRHGEVWRLITPIFLHFGLLHIIFNMLWLLDLGGLIESRKGPIFFAILVLVTAIISNLAQYYQSDPSFGGMSGVVYGLFGYAWIKGRFDPASGIGVRQETAGMMLVWLVLCMTGLLGNIANTAHVVGLIVGVGVAYAPHALRRARR